MNCEAGVRYLLEVKPACRLLIEQAVDAAGQVPRVHLA